MSRPVIDYTAPNRQPRDSKLVKSRRLEELDSKKPDTDILESAAFFDGDPYDPKSKLGNRKPDPRPSDESSDVDRGSHEFNQSLKRHQLLTNDYNPNY